jgi:hypothetical protein
LSAIFQMNATLFSKPAGVAMLPLRHRSMMLIGVILSHLARSTNVQVSGQSSQEGQRLASGALRQGFVVPPAAAACARRT